jgi:hypothetical protein
MATRVFAYERHEYRFFGRKKVIERGAVAELDDALAKKQVAAHPDKLLILNDGELPPVLDGNVRGESRTVVMVRPGFDRAMIPGRLSRQKRNQLKAAKKRSRNARMMVSE